MQLVAVFFLSAILPVLSMPLWKSIPSQGMPALSGACAAYSEDLDVMVMFGGEDSSNRFESSLYVYAFNTSEWTIHFSESPPGRKWATLTRVSLNSFLLIGGTNSNTNHDMYELTLQKKISSGLVYPKWTLLANASTQLLLGSINMHQTVYRYGDDTVYVFGGYRFHPSPLSNSFQASNALWSFSNGSWTEILPQQNQAWPPARFGFSMTLFSSPLGAEFDSLVLFGGRTTLGSDLNDVWQYSFSTRMWQEIMGQTNTLPFRSLGALFENSFGQLMYVGGAISSGMENCPDTSVDTILLSSVDASQVFCESASWCFLDDDEFPIRPLARSDFAWVLRNKGIEFIVFGGMFSLNNTCLEQPLGDFWMLNVSLALELPKTPFVVAPAAPVVPSRFELKGGLLQVVYFLGATCVLLVGFLLSNKLVQRHQRQQARLAAARATAAQQRSSKPPEAGYSLDTINALQLQAFEELDDKEHETCSICFEPFQPSDQVRVLVCRHFFHPECVDAWLVKHTTCPLCKHHAAATVEEESS